MFFCQRIKSAGITIVFQDKNMGEKSKIANLASGDSLLTLRR